MDIDRDPTNDPANYPELVNEAGDDGEVDPNGEEVEEGASSVFDPESSYATEDTTPRDVRAYFSGQRLDGRLELEDINWSRWRLGKDGRLPDGARLVLHHGLVAYLSQNGQTVSLAPYNLAHCPLSGVPRVAQKADMPQNQSSSTTRSNTSKTYQHSQNGQ